MLLLATFTVLIFAAWVVALRAVLEKQDLMRIFAALISSFLLYISIELTLWFNGFPLGIMLCFGIVPLLLIMYGFRAYDYKMQAEKLKNDEKFKREQV